MATHDLNVARWKKLREYVLRRDSYLDQIALRYGKRVEATTVHHIFPREFFPEYTFSEWNLISLSNSSHNRLHDRDSHKLTNEGFELLRRTAKKRGMELSDGLRSVLT